MVLLIDPSDIAQIEMTPREVIDVVESAYRQDGMGLAEETPRLEIKIKGKDLPHIAQGTTSVGQGMVFLEESKVFIISYTRARAIGAKYMANKDFEAVGIIGTGSTRSTHIQGGGGTTHSQSS